MFSQPVKKNIWRDARDLLLYRLKHIDRPAWRRFFLAMFALTLSFFLALYSTILKESGRNGLAAAMAGLSLLLTAFVAIKLIPYLARRTALEGWLVKVEYEFTREGAVYLAMIAILAVAALNTGNNLLFLILASLLAGILVSGILSKIILSGLELEFFLPDHVFADRPIPSRLTLHNLKWFFPSFSIFVSGVKPGKSGRKRRRRKNADTASRHILNQPVYVPYIPRRASVTQHVELTFPRRGRYTQEGFRVATKFPFGFLLKAHEVPTRQEILVLPNAKPTGPLYQILAFVGGEVESFLKGHGHDLYAIRDYHEYDTARQVDWKATAKTQQLKVREFTREDECRMVMVLDVRVPTLNESTLEQFEKGVTLCASLAWQFHEAGVQIQFMSEDFETKMAPAAEIIYPILENLAIVEPRPKPGLVNEALGTLFRRLATSQAGFNIVFTFQPRGSIPAHLWSSSHFVFLDSV